MKYRYYFTKPMINKRYLKKDCQFCIYQEKLPIYKLAIKAYGHIEYAEPLTAEEMKKYGLVFGGLEVDAAFNLTNNQVYELHKLLKSYKNHQREDGSKPFKDFEIADLFKLLMSVNSCYLVSKLLEREEMFQGKL